jgi:hypothetical protein
MAYFRPEKSESSSRIGLDLGSGVGVGPALFGLGDAPRPDSRALAIGATEEDGAGALLGGPADVLPGAAAEAMTGLD